MTSFINLMFKFFLSRNHKRVYFPLLTLNKVLLAVLNIVSVLICQYFKFQLPREQFKLQNRPMECIGL